MAEGILECVIQHRYTNVEKRLHGRPVPAHLLFLIHALGHDLIDRTLDERSRDRLTRKLMSSVCKSMSSLCVLSCCPHQENPPIPPKDFPILTPYRSADRVADNGHPILSVGKCIQHRGVVGLRLL
jgi:hypothetical protein